MVVENVIENLRDPIMTFSPCNNTFIRLRGTLNRHPKGSKWDIVSLRITLLLTCCFNHDRSLKNFLSILDMSWCLDCPIRFFFESVKVPMKLIESVRLSHSKPRKGIMVSTSLFSDSCFRLVQKNLSWSPNLWWASLRSKTWAISTLNQKRTMTCIVGATKSQMSTIRPSLSCKGR